MSGNTGQLTPSDVMHCTINTWRFIGLFPRHKKANAGKREGGEHICFGGCETQALKPPSNLATGCIDVSKLYMETNVCKSSLSCTWEEYTTSDRTSCLDKCIMCTLVRAGAVVGAVLAVVQSQSAGCSVSSPGVNETTLHFLC
eukprot:1160782-Pelagomonas_calceolata.AAC.4